MDLTIFRRRSPATLRERVESRRERQRQSYHNRSPREARAALEILGTLDTPEAASMARPHGKAHGQGVLRRLNAVNKLYAQGRSYVMDELLSGDRPQMPRHLPRQHVEVENAIEMVRFPEPRRSHPSDRYAAGSRAQATYRPRNIFAPSPPQMVRQAGGSWQFGPPNIDWHGIAEVLPALFALALVGMVLMAFLSRNLNPNRGKTPKVQAAAVPAAVVPTQPPGKKTTILVLGSDRREKDASFRTDVIVLVTIDPAKGEVSTVSFPRDLVAKVPGYGDDRINVVMQYGGFELMQDTFENSYGARPEYYFMTNFDGFRDMINSIGGVEVEIGQPLSDACDLYWSKGGTCEVQPGKMLMDGDSALWYVRSRHSTSDFDRLRRAQEVLGGVFARFMTMNALARAPELYAQYTSNVETNMNIVQMASLLPVAAQVAQDQSRLHRYAISSAEAADWFMGNGARVLLPDYEAVKRIVREATGE